MTHRDIKPANIKLTEDGDEILVDFGIAEADHVQAPLQQVLRVTLQGMLPLYGMYMGEPDIFQTNSPQLPRCMHF